MFASFPSSFPMKKRLLLLALSLLLFGGLSAQKYSTETGFISFYSKKGKIKAENRSVSSQLNTAENTITFTVPVNGFVFKNATMQKHFNNPGVMDSEQYPTATFKGNILAEKPLDWTKDGSHPVKVKGKLTIKDTAQEVEEAGTITIEAGQIKANATFALDRFLYNVDGKKGSVSKELEIEANISYEQN